MFPKFINFNLNSSKLLLYFTLLGRLFQRFYTLKEYIISEQSFLVGVSWFAGNKESVLKWCMNRPYQVKHYRELLNLAALDPSNDPCKPLRPADITSSEQHIRNVIGDLQAEYSNPIDKGLDINELYNHNSGISLKKNVEDLLNIWDNGKVQADEFSEKRIFSKDIPFHQPMKKIK